MKGRLSAMETKNDWRWQLDNTVRTWDPHGVDRDLADRVLDRFPMSVTPYYLSLMRADDPDDPIRRMAFPHLDELSSFGSTVDDPIREEDHAVLPGLIRRYPDRALLLVSGDCPVHCRHCTRRNMGRGKIVPVRGEGLARALAYIENTPEIRDVIISGGDPLVLEDRDLVDILSRVRSIPSVEIIRIGTRVPVTLPMRITEGLARDIARHGPVYVNTQFNHPAEMTDEALAAVGCLVDAGVPVNNQAVLLAGVNDSSEIIEDLCRALMRARVRPYYIFMCDLVPGIGHFRVSLDKGIEIMAHLRGRIGGLGIPQLVIDLPGGLGKIPVGPRYLIGREEGKTILRAPDGTPVEYPDPTSTTPSPR
jgi:lysine 2,3-aminomutase